MFMKCNSQRLGGKWYLVHLRPQDPLIPLRCLYRRRMRKTVCVGTRSLRNATRSKGARHAARHALYSFARCGNRRRRAGAIAGLRSWRPRDLSVFDTARQGRRGNGEGGDGQRVGAQAKC